jgi:transcriptional regulator with XRE-family HTH domain
MEYRILEQIEKKGLTVTDFVEKMGWKQRSSFYNIMNGNPTIPVLERMAKILECRVIDLLKEEGDIPEITPQTPTFICPHCGKPLDVVVQKKEKDLD